MAASVTIAARQRIHQGGCAATSSRSGLIEKQWPTSPNAHDGDLVRAPLRGTVDEGDKQLYSC
jgi:hypothetical protein